MIIGMVQGGAAARGKRVPCVGLLHSFSLPQRRWQTSPAIERIQRLSVQVQKPAFRQAIDRNHRLSLQRRSISRVERFPLRGYRRHSLGGQSQRLAGFFAFCFSLHCSNRVSNIGFRHRDAVSGFRVASFDLRPGKYLRDSLHGFLLSINDDIQVSCMIDRGKRIRNMDAAE